VLGQYFAQQEVEEAEAEKINQRVPTADLQQLTFKVSPAFRKRFRARAFHDS
jgi:hypothetical protein